MAKKFLSQLVDELTEIDDNKEMEEFLKALLTPQELEDIPKRLEIVRLLKEGLPQREIIQRLGVGIATVTRGSTAMKMKGFRDREL